MNEPSVSSPDANSGRLRERLANFRAHVKSALPFASGILAALLGVLLYNLLFPGPQQLTGREVNDLVVQAMASATPRPAFSSRVFQAIQPSLVLIQTKGGDGDHEHGPARTGVQAIPGKASRRSSPT